MIAFPLVALEPLRLYRNDRNAEGLAGPAADPFEVVADDADDAGRVHKGGLGLVAADEFFQGGVELLFAAEDHVDFLEIGGEAQAVQFRPRGESAADVPGIGGTANGAMDQVQSIGYGVEHHPRAAEHAGPLAHGAGRTVPVAAELEALAPFAVNLFSAFFQNGGIHGLVSILDGRDMEFPRHWLYECAYRDIILFVTPAKAGV